MKKCLTGLTFLAAALSASIAGAADKPASQMNLIPSWGDMTLVYGPGTDAAMDTPEAMANMVKHWKGRGFTGVYLRTDLTQFPPGSIIRHAGKKQENPGLAVFWHLVDEILEKADPHTSARMAVEGQGFEYWINHPHIYSEGAPEDAGVDGPGRMVPWSYMLKYHAEHPEVITVDREGNKQWMVPEYAYPGVRASKAAEFAHLARTYRPSGIIASMRSETSQLIPPPDHGDQYGFNQIVVDEMKEKYKVDILTDPRFDWKSPAFNAQDPMLQNWRELRGTHITQLYREIRQAIRGADPKVQFAVTLSGEYVGPLMGNARLEWREWIDEGIVDVIILPVTFEATQDLEAHKKGYLTDVRAGKGTVTVDQIKQYVSKSKHPKIKVIQTGAPSYFYPPPPEGADGWQCDAWYDSYHVAWYQRWQQWHKDLEEFGTIKFFEQNFDGFAVKDPGQAGGIGDGRHHPELRATPGVWYKVGDGTDGRPVIQQQVRRGDTGNAVALTAKELTAVHYSSPDRSLLTGVLDTAIANGKTTLSCWAYRANEQNALTVIFTGTASYERDVAVRIAAKTGRVSYANGKSWVETDVTVPLKRWEKISIGVDLDAMTYSAQVGDDKKGNVCSGIAISKPVERIVTQHGVNLPIKVPAYRIFNALMFVPVEGSREPVYVDDVLVNWTPTLHYAKPGSRKLLDENFESAKSGATGFGRELRVAGAANGTKPFFVERTTSYGKGVHCARAAGGAALVSDLGITPASAKGTVTVDFDTYIRSDEGFPYILPNPATKSPHSVVISLEGSSPDKPFAAIDTTGGTWKLWDGQKYVDTGKGINYDVWNHVQLAIDAKAKTYRLIVQPVGSLPTVIGEAACGELPKATDKLALKISPSATKGHISCYDNLLVTME
jgi:hypothetical protein